MVNAQSRRVAICALLALALAPISARGLDQGITGKKLQLKGTKFVLLSKDVSITPAGADPVGGADSWLSFDDGGGPVVHALPAVHWSGNGSSTRFKYKNASAPAGPSVVKLVRLKSGLIKVVGKGAAFPIPNGMATLSVILSLDGGATRYCMAFNGTGDGQRFVARDASAGTCPLPTATPSDTATPTPTPIDTATPAATPSDTATPAATSTDTSTPVATSTDTATPAATPTHTATPTATGTATATETASSTVTPPEPVTFEFTGAEQTWVVPSGVTLVDVDVRGAQGADGNTPADAGGLGGRVLTSLAVTPGETLYIYVGGQGGIAVPLTNTAGAGGFNGGANGAIDNVDANGPSGGGGGASDIRQGGNLLSDRIVVAGGGGAAECCGDGNGGAGGGVTGSPGSAATGTGGGGGTQAVGGAGGSSTGDSGSGGILGQGGAGGNGNRAGGGGGGGYYGGGGGAGGFLGNGGGGGSGYPPAATHSLGYQSGDGVVIIAYTP